MAIFGNFSDMPLPDVLSMVGRGMGRFLIWNLPSPHTHELHVCRGSLVAMFTDQSAVQEPLQVRSNFIDLFNAPAGDFEFVRLPKEQLHSFIAMPLEQLMLASLASVDEITSFRDNLPSVHTLFKHVGQQDVWLDDDLTAFWELAEPYLRVGTDAATIATYTGLSLDHIALSLYKLRLAGLIQPIRTWEIAQTDPYQRRTTPLPTIREEEVIARKEQNTARSTGTASATGSLRHRTPTRRLPQTEEAATAATAQMENGAPDDHPDEDRLEKIRQVEIYQPAPSLMNKLIQSLSFNLSSREDKS